MTPDIWISLLVSAGFWLTGVYVALLRRMRVIWPLGVILLFFCGELTFAHAMQGLSTDFGARVFWYKLTLLGFSAPPTLFFCITLRYGGFGRWLTRRNRLIIFILPLLTVGLILTNEWHGLIWNPAATEQIVTTTVFLSAATAGAWYWFYVFYSYLMMALGFLVLTWLVIRARNIYIWQVAAMIFGGCLTVLGSSMDAFGFSPLPPFTATAVGIATGTITAALTLGRIRRRDLISVSHTAIIRSIGDSILVVDADHMVVDVNPAAEKMFGKSAAKCIGKPVDELLPEFAGCWNTPPEGLCDAKIMLDHSPHIFDMRISTINDWRGKFVCKVAVLRDITDQKRAEEDLRRATAGTQAIFWRAMVTKTGDETGPGGEYAWDTNYSNLDQVNEFLPLRPYADCSYSDMFYFSELEEDRLLMDQVSTAALRRGAPGYSQEFRIRDANDRIHWMYENARIQPLSDTRFEVLGFITDITERKAIEEALRESETRLATFFENEPTGNIIVNSHTRLIYDVNPSALEMIGLSKEKVVGKMCHGFLCPAEFGQCPVCDLGSSVDRSERILLKPDGSRIQILKTVVPIKIKGEDYLLESFIDITDRKEAEEKILASIEEKEALLKEIHHRVKNNMQIISSLLSLQVSTITDPKTIDVFRDSQNRIRSMALIHEKLYHSHNLARIRFDEYLEELTTFLMRAYSQPAHNIRLLVEAEPVQMDIDSAIPCGLIINELVTNSLKHAFPGLSRAEAGVKGTIRVRLAVLPENLMRLSVADDGVGFPEGVDFLSTGSLGLQLVASLTEQLEGRYSCTNHNGAQVEIVFTSKGAPGPQRLG